LWGVLTSPEGDAQWDERVAKLQSDLEIFVTEKEITPKYLFLLYPAQDAVWEIRSVRNRPSLRVLGRFPIQDVLIVTNFARREDLGGWQSRAWKAVKRKALAVWRALFPTYPAIQTTDVRQVCSGASDEIFYKERR
jgi:hypothetical protein